MTHWLRPCDLVSVLMMPEIKFHTRFGGKPSVLQELEDLADHMPGWFAPIWRGLIAMLKPLVIQAQVKREMKRVDQQAKDIGDKWARSERTQMAQQAVRKAQQEHPKAVVTVYETPQHPTDGILILHPVDPATGLETIEIRAAFDH